MRNRRNAAGYWQPQTLTGERADEVPDADGPEDDSTEPRVSLSDAMERLARFESLASRVREGDYSALDAFRDVCPKPSIRLKEDIRVPDREGREKPVALCNIASYSPEEIAERVALMKKYFPKTEIRRVESADGKPVLALVGIDCQTANAAVRLENRLREAQESVTRLTPDKQPEPIPSDVTNSAREAARAVVAPVGCSSVASSGVERRSRSSPIQQR